MPGKKHQDVSAALGIDDQLFDASVPGVWTRRPVHGAIFDADLVAPPFGTHDRAIVEEPGDRLGVEGRRHDDQDQVGADFAANFAQKCQRKVAIQVALVKFVENDGPDRFKKRVVQKLAGEDAFGQESEPGSVRKPPVEADLVADLFAEGPSLLIGDPCRRGPRSHAAGLEHDHAGMVR